MDITKELWATTPDGKEIFLYTLKNASGAYAMPVLTQDDQFNSGFFCSEQFPAETLVLLRDVPAEFLQIFLPVDHQPPIVERLVITAVQFRPEVSNTHCVELALDPRRFVLVLPGVDLDRHQNGISSVLISTGVNPAGTGAAP